MAKQKSQKIEAVFDKDLEKVLRGLNLYEKIEQGEINCYFCKELITFENLQFIFTKDKKIQISCSKSVCIDKFKTTVKNGN